MICTRQGEHENRDCLSTSETAEMDPENSAADVVGHLSRSRIVAVRPLQGESELGADALRDDSNPLSE
jgi:hypothetical protein